MNFTTLNFMTLKEISATKVTRMEAEGSSKGDKFP